MWFLVLMTIVNAVLHQQAVQNVYRISFGIIQLGIIDGLMFVSVLWLVFRGGSIRSMFPSPRTHPILVWIMGLMILGGVFGMLGGVLNHNNPKYMLSSAREYLALPLCVLAGYRLLGTPKHVKRMAVCEIIAGVLTAGCLFWAFGEKTEEAQLTGALNPLRAGILHWNSEYAAVTGLVAIFVIMTRYKLWRMPIVMLLGLFSYIAYASTLSRSGFLILLIGTASTFMLLPKGERFRKFVRGVVFMPILVFACWGALNLGDAIVGRGFASKVNKHFMTLIPDSDRSGSDEKAWDSRLGGIAAEIALWSRSPLTGQGFGAGETEYLAGHASGGVAFKHNGWTSSLAETGLFGFAGLALLVATLLRLGYKAVHDRIDPGCVLMGAVAFLSGVTFLLRCSTTYAVTSRSALAYGLICGMIIRAREIQQTCRALAFQQQQQQQQYDPYVDERTGLVVPDYGYSDYGYGYSDYAPGFGYN